MKVICVTHDYSGEWSSFSAYDMLTIGEWYEVLEEHDTYYTIDWREGYKYTHATNIVWAQANLSKSYFKTIDEIREEKLNGLCL
jgi:hypothetical protein